MNEAPSHDTVGWRFHGCDGGIYLCTKWDRRSGFVMRVIGFNESGMTKTEFNRGIGDEASVSERAIDHSYHRLRQNHPMYQESPEPHHAEGCNCWICEKRKRP